MMKYLILGIIVLLSVILLLMFFGFWKIFLSVLVLVGGFFLIKLLIFRLFKKTDELA